MTSKGERTRERGGREIEKERDGEKREGEWEKMGERSGKERERERGVKEEGRNTLIHFVCHV